MQAFTVYLLFERLGIFDSRTLYPLTLSGGAEQVEQAPQKQRKSVAFSEGSVIMDTNGEVTEAPKVEKPTENEGTITPNPFSLCSVHLVRNPCPVV